MIHKKAITLKQLRALSAIVQAGSLTAAAEILHVTTPAVSTQLRALELNFSEKMMSRGPDGKIELTPVGRVVLAATAQIENSLSNCFSNITALKSGKTGHVVLGVVSTAKYFAPSIIAKAQHALPDIEIGMFVGNRAAIIDGLKGKKIDLAIMGRPPRDPPVEADMLGENPHVLIAAPDHPLVGKGRISTPDLLKQTFLSREPGSGTRILMERFLDNLSDGTPYATIELDSNETIKQATIAGLGVAIISAHTVTGELESGRLALIHHPGLPITRTWFLLRRAGRTLPPATQIFVEFLLGLKGNFLPKM
ncbi:MAG: LysR family transcriptional regulator [Rhodobacteraceae bacterium]|nr:LysR family transcriptional regulator [Paracoccaceae bacterium]